MYQIPLEKFLKDLQKRDGVPELYEQILHEKALDLLEKNAVMRYAAIHAAGSGRESKLTGN